MKKTYINPMMTTFKVNVESYLLEGSIKIDGAKTSGTTKGGWTKDQGSWGDVWDDTDNDDE